MQNANPMVFKAKQERVILPEEEDDSVVDKIDEREVFDILFSVFIITIIQLLCCFENIMTCLNVLLPVLLMKAKTLTSELNQASFIRYRVKVM